MTTINDPYKYASMWHMENKMCWHINDLCNLKCEYCFFPFYEKESPEVGRLNPRQILEAFNNTGRQWHLYIAGGEPLLYPDFVELVNLLKPYHPIQISTNLYNKKVKEFVNNVSPDNIIIINASLHIGLHNEKSLNQFIKNYHMFREKGFNIVVSYVTYPPLFSRIEKDFEFLKQQGVEHIHPLTFQGIYEGKKYPGSYTKEQINIIRKHTLEPMELLVTTDSMNFKNKLCKAGKNYFFMDIKGDVYKCVTINEPCGNIFDGTFSPADEPIRCPVSKCNDSCLGITSLLEIPEMPDIKPQQKKIFSSRFQKVKDYFLSKS
jgi:MoaA/NifB/PqqE/SkfB family radical SAM enzyme